MNRFIKTAFEISAAIGFTCLNLGAASPPPNENEIQAALDAKTSYPRIEIQNPANETLFPPEMPPPEFRWRDAELGVDAWLVKVHSRRPPTASARPNPKQPSGPNGPVRLFQKILALTKLGRIRAKVLSAPRRWGISRIRWTRTLRLCSSESRCPGGDRHQKPGG